MDIDIKDKTIKAQSLLTTNNLYDVFQIDLDISYPYCTYTT